MNKTFIDPCKGNLVGSIKDFAIHKANQIATAFTMIAVTFIITCIFVGILFNSEREMTMDKKNVMKALSLCGTGSESCTGCPYYAMGGCDRHMCDDALALLKADEKANEKPAYHKAFIFTKRDNLVKYFWCKPALPNQEYYAREREIQLILLVRFENGKCICRIKCPINPLPIKGEFQCVSTSEMFKLLTSMGWTYKAKYGIGMFR